MTTRLEPVRSRLAPAIAAFTIAVLAGSAPVDAQTEIVPFDSSQGYNHVDTPPPGASSSADFCFSFSDPSLVGDSIEVVADGPTGAVSGTGTVDENGVTKVRVGITQGGSYAVSSITATESGQTISTSGVPVLDVVFDPEFLDCGDSLALAPPPTTIAETTTSIETTTTAASTTAPSTVASSTTPPATAPPSVPEPPPVESGSSSNWPVHFMVIGTLLAFFGAFVSFFPGLDVGGTRPRCEREREDVERWKADLEKEKRKLKAAEENDERIKLALEGRPDYREEQRLLKESDRSVAALRSARISVETVSGTLDKARSALAACERRGGTTTRPPGGGTGGPGTAPPPIDTTTKRPPPPDCCTSGDWIGVNVFTGGSLVLGVQSGYVQLWCIDNPDRTATIAWTGIRWGVALGGEAGAGLFVVVDGGGHPSELVGPVGDILGGVDVDVTLGLGWTKLAKGLFKTGGKFSKLRQLGSAINNAESAADAIKKAKDAGNAAEAAHIAQKNADDIAALIRDGTAAELAKEISTAQAKGASSVAQSKASGLNLPFGKGVQIGGWYMQMWNVELWDVSGCKYCDGLD